jgi:hypothetical protein
LLATQAARQCNTTQPPLSHRSDQWGDGRKGALAAAIPPLYNSAGASENAHADRRVAVAAGLHLHSPAHPATGHAWFPPPRNHKPQTTSFFLLPSSSRTFPSPNPGPWAHGGPGPSLGEDSPDPCRSPVVVNGPVGRPLPSPPRAPPMGCQPPLVDV